MVSRNGFLLVIGICEFMGHLHLMHSMSCRSELDFKCVRLKYPSY